MEGARETRARLLCCGDADPAPEPGPLDQPVRARVRRRGVAALPVELDRTALDEDRDLRALLVKPQTARCGEVCSGAFEPPARNPIPAVLPDLDLDRATGGDLPLPAQRGRPAHAGRRCRRGGE